MKYILNLIFMTLCFSAFSQSFAPPAGELGSTAISADSSIIKSWANDCIIDRGLLDIANPEIGFVTYGEAQNATGKSDNNPVSLGDGGFAIVSFAAPFANHVGFDFAVFENGFSDTFLELAFVEVSSDGVHFVRFPAISELQTETQTPGFGEMDTRYIHNFAGKYRASFGTPFDLEELQDSAGIDIHNIIHIRIVDAIGSINPEFATHDSQGNIVNEPYPTPFESGGFDLDAVALLKEPTTEISKINSELQFQITQNQIIIENQSDMICVYSIDGSLIRRISDKNSIDISNLSKGIYILYIQDNKKTFTQKFIKL